MKTINDLVDRLNAKFDYGYFYVDKDDDMETYTIFMRVPGDTYRVIEMSKYNKRWLAQPSFGVVSIEVQKEIMDFVYTTDKDHWFDEPEKKYNIIIGKNEREKIKTAYQKLHDGTYIADSVEEDDLKRDRYIFTESEIEDLKSRLPENMAKIVDLGKVEVTNED